MPDVAIERIRGVQLFSGLDRRALKHVAESMRERRFAPGHEVTEEGEHGYSFFVIDEGEAEVTVGGAQRAMLGVGDSFGELALITGRERMATVTAKTDLRCFALTGWDFQRLVRENAEVAWQLLETLARILEDERQTRRGVDSVG
jgi:CRP-like cAMP-binding protein